MAREERKKLITRQREAQILEAALEVFSARGFGAATVPEIAERAGLAVGSIYNYFPSKRELFVGVIKYFILNAPLMNLIDELPKGDIAATFTRIMHNRMNLIDSKDISRIPFLMAEVQRDPELKTLWSKELLQPFLSKIEGIYRNLAENIGRDDIDPAIMVRIVGGMILGFLMFRIMEGEDSPVYELPREKITEDLVNFLMFGLYGKKVNEDTRRNDL